MGPEGFGEKLGDLIDAARADGSVISPERVRELMDMPGMTDEQWDLVYHYLEIEGIEVKGHEKNAEVAHRLAKGADATEEPAASAEADPMGVPMDDSMGLLEDGEEEAGEHTSVMALYMEELEALTPLTAEEEELYTKRLVLGDPEAVRKITEAKLKLSLRIASGYAGRGIADGDLVQEANMLLMTALMDYMDGDLDKFIEDRIRAGLDSLVQDEFAFDDMSSHIAEQANALLAVSTELSEELGREATAEELAAHLHMDKNRVEEMLKMSLNAVNTMQMGNVGIGREETE